MKKRILPLSGLVLATAFAFTGCSGGGSSDPVVAVQQPLQQSVEKFVVSGMLTDPAGAQIAGSVTLSAIDSTGAAVKLYSDSTGGSQLTTVAVPDGLISFFVADTAALPVSVKVVADAPGRVSSSALFTIDKPGSSSFSIRLVDPASTTTAGVASGNTQVTADAAAGLAAPLITNVIAADTSKTSAQVSIPASAVLRDSSGAPLSGTVTATVTTFAPPTASSPINDSTVTSALALENFPGGLDNALIASASPQTPAASGAFATAGFVAVNITDADGKQAKSSSTPFTIRMDIPAGTINPETGLPLAADGTTTIPIWTYNEKDATWKAEIDAGGNQVLGLVKQDAKGLYVEYTTNHFSYWNLDWHYNSCTVTANLTNDLIKLPLTVKLAFSNGAGFLANTSKSSGDSIVGFRNTPKGKKFDLYLINSAGSVVASKKNFDWCAQPASTISLDYVAPAAQKPVPVTVSVSEFCTQDPTVTRSVPSAQTYAISTSFTSSGTTLANGSYVYNLIPGSYSFYSYNRTTGRYISKTNVAISAAQTIVFSNPVQCKPVTGATGSSGVSFRRLLNL